MHFQGNYAGLQVMIPMIFLVAAPARPRDDVAGQEP